MYNSLRPLQARIRGFLVRRRVVKKWKALFEQQVKLTGNMSATAPWKYQNDVIPLGGFHVLTATSCAGGSIQDLVEF